MSVKPNHLEINIELRKRMDLFLGKGFYYSPIQLLIQFY